MQEGIPVPQQGTLAFEVQAPISATHSIGTTQYGEREVLQLGAGTVSGPRLEGQLLDGGLDFHLTLDDGSVQVEQVAMLSLTGGQLAYLRNCGVAANGTSTVRVVPDFEAATGGSAAWLHDARLVGTRTVDPAAGTLTLSFYEVAADAASTDANPIQLPVVSGAAQSWACVSGSGGLGVEVFRETVSVGPILAVGTTKRGARTVIPITGGTATGQFEGSIVGAGADFQLDLTSPTAELDARYLIRDGQNETVIVRNCGAFGSLTPLFEARVGGPYAWLNDGAWRSADPIIGIGFVTIVIHEG
jgi:hypothetical protein